MRGHSLWHRSRDLQNLETWRQRLGWASPPERRSLMAFPGDSLPHGVGAANSGLHSTSCRSSDAGEVHSLGQKHKRCNIFSCNCLECSYCLFLAFNLAFHHPRLGVWTHTQSSVPPPRVNTTWNRLNIRSKAGTPGQALSAERAAALTALPRPTLNKQSS